jgi:hypothetical protein
MFDHAPVDLSEDIKNRMLEEAVKRGSAATVKVYYELLGVSIFSLMFVCMCN